MTTELRAATAPGRMFPPSEDLRHTWRAKSADPASEHVIDPRQLRMPTKGLQLAIIDGDTLAQNCLGRGRARIETSAAANQEATSEIGSRQDRR